MTDDAEDLARGEIDEESLARWFKSGREDPQTHPSLEKISAYQAGELPPEEADTIQEHLVQCTFCTAIFQDLKGFLEAGEDQVQEGVADLGAETGWRKIRTEMGWTGGKDPSEEASRLKKALRRLRMLAAVLLVGVLGLSVYAWRLWQELKTIDTHVSASPINQKGARSTPEDAAETLVASPGDSIFFTLDDLRVPSGDFRVEIHDSSGRTVWNRPSLKMREGYLAFRVPPNVLKPGSYTMRVFTKDGTAVGEYFVKIVLPL